MPQATATLSANPSTPTPTAEEILRVEDLEFCYGKSVALEDINLSIPSRKVTAFIGPSGCGKSTLLRGFNRMNDEVDGARITKGRILLEGTDLYDPSIDAVRLRRQVGMVFQKSNPFPRSIFDNIAYGLQIGGETDRERIREAVERSLRQAALWDEVKDRLSESAFGLSGGQQQRLCIARAIAVQPSVLLMDEPCSALDPVATARVEELIHKLAENYTVVIVTHNMQQATRVSDLTAFFYLGKLIEFAPTGRLFSSPSKPETEAYITGRFG